MVVNLLIPLVLCAMNMPRGSASICKHYEFAKHDCEEAFAAIEKKSTGPVRIGFDLQRMKPGYDACEFIAPLRLFAKVRGSPVMISEGIIMMRTLNNEEARGLLQTARVARLGCIVNGEPYVVPINCHLEGDYLYSHSLAGLKITGLRENPNACVQVDEIESELRWRSAIAFGKYEEITRPSERAEILNTLLHRFPMLTPVESTIAVDGSAPEVIVFRIRIDRLTGVTEG